MVQATPKPPSLRRQRVFGVAVAIGVLGGLVFGVRSCQAWQLRLDLEALAKAYAEAPKPSCSHSPDDSRLRAALIDNNGLGPRLVQHLLHENGGGLDAAYDALKPSLPYGLSGAERTGPILQDGGARSARSAALVIASMPCINLAETTVLTVPTDPEWSRDECPSRRFTNVASGVDVSNHLKLHGNPPFRSSYYSWRYNERIHGSGDDEVLPIVDEQGTVRAHLILSLYEDTYNDAGEEQLAAVKKWRSEAERFQRVWDSRPSAEQGEKR